MSEAASDLTLDEWSDDELFAVVREERLPSAEGVDRGRALEVLFERYHTRVYSQCCRLLGDEDLAYDLTQEVFLSFLERPPGYDARRHFSSWLYVLVRNRCFNLRRHQRHEVATEEMEEVWATELIDPADPALEVEQGEMARLVAGICKEELSPREQEVVHLRYYWGLRVKEINQVIGLTNTSGARTHLATAHRKLRQALRAQFGEKALFNFLGDE
jgi:RNA polymerase sigma-70 factor (ECF subfamily)